MLRGADTPKHPYTTWSDYGGAADSMQYSALKQINKTNVAKLELAWSYAVPDRRGNFGFNPIVADGMMYVLRPEELPSLRSDALTGKANLVRIRWRVNIVSAARHQLLA